MPLVHSKEAIGGVSELLQTQLLTKTSASSVDVGRLEEAAKSAGPKFNLFLYQLDMDGHFRNHPLDEGQNPPLWIVLHYLITAFDNGKESDSIDAHKLLGEGLLALQELNYIRPASRALAENPEPLKITFDSAESELLSKIMQGTDEKYRVSAAFQVRPVMIASTVPPRYALSVKTVGPPGVEGVAVLPTLGPRLKSVQPEKFPAGTEIAVRGLDVGIEVSEVRIGATSFGVTDAKNGEVKTTVPTTTTLSAGVYPIFLIRKLPAGHELKSDSLLVQLLPTITTATPGSPTPLTTSAGKVSGGLTLNGTLLGGPEDAVFVAFYKDGDVALMLEATGTVAQTSLTLNVSIDDGLDASDYYIILRVNGVQAADAPKVNWS